MSTTTIWAVRMPTAFVIDTLEGTMAGKAGDWLAKGVKGELYPIDAAVFERRMKRLSSEVIDQAVFHP